MTTSGAHAPDWITSLFTDTWARESRHGQMILEAASIPSCGIPQTLGPGAAAADLGPAPRVLQGTGKAETAGGRQKKVRPAAWGRPISEAGDLRNTLAPVEMNLFVRVAGGPLKKARRNGRRPRASARGTASGGNQAARVAPGDSRPCNLPAGCQQGITSPIRAWDGSFRRITLPAPRPSAAS